MTKLYLSKFMKIKGDINMDTHTSLPLPIKQGVWVGIILNSLLSWYTFK